MKSMRTMKKRSLHPLEYFHQLNSSGIVCWSCSCEVRHVLLEECIQPQCIGYRSQFVHLFLLEFCHSRVLLQVEVCLAFRLESEELDGLRSLDQEDVLGVFQVHLRPPFWCPSSLPWLFVCLERNPSLWIFRTTSLLSIVLGVADGDHHFHENCPTELFVLRSGRSVSHRSFGHLSTEPPGQDKSSRGEA